MLEEEENTRLIEVCKMYKDLSYTRYDDKEAKVERFRDIVEILCLHRGSVETFDFKRKINYQIDDYIQFGKEIQGLSSYDLRILKDTVERIYSDELKWIRYIVCSRFLGIKTRKKKLLKDRIEVKIETLLYYMVEIVLSRCDIPTNIKEELTNNAFFIESVCLFLKHELKAKEGK